MDAQRIPSRASATRFALAIAWSIVWRIAVFFIAWGSITAPFMVVGQSRLAGWSETHPTMARFFGDGVVALAILVASWLLMHFVDKRPVKEIGLEGPRRLTKFTLGLGIGVVWLAVPLAIVWFVRCVNPVEHPAFPWAAMPVAALALIVNVTAQQLLLCGYTFTMTRVRAGLVPAVALSGLLFVGYHAAGYHGAWLPGFNVFLTAVLFCLARSPQVRKPGGWSAFRLEGPAWATGGERAKPNLGRLERLSP